ncbi:Branched-chain amino acid transport ATP-binding protein LivG (TC 3.A.1.4.1) [Patulibacter medicamentivorans]|uniref:Branched-chain amino acid transport ATP-binding protein LivG (TC 3.A.1.4.1) n=1 Tax=Patulibacter medicamentivorans TaxID=1097667 RepID=H0E666_9ACTN|nr:ATP-binding cassette domain-containing protein [Patulibacter medicamentivorans]EHN10835.1 Branched-chain amino acid transport ATP-binding protein LivG (TC 3.A.1.4.1) [Patulibacter medicamentivorans]
MIVVDDLTVRFGGVTPLDAMTVTFGGGVSGLLGPNGAGKTTFFNVLSGFVRPAAGTVRAFDDDLLAMVDFRRARWGLRRCFQQERAIAQLSATENVLLLAEQVGIPRGDRRRRVLDALEFVGLDDATDQPVGMLSAYDRRRAELARAIVGAPRLVLLDEPAAGLPDSESRDLARLIASIPDRRGAAVIVVDHDIDLVQSCCATATVLDFGRVLASGPTADVLADPRVIHAYLGTEGS